MQDRRHFLLKTTQYVTILPAGCILNKVGLLSREKLEIRTYLFVNLSENKLKNSERGHLLNLLREEPTEDHYLPEGLNLKIYFAKNKNHAPLAKNIANNLTNLGIPCNIEGLPEKQFWPSWSDRDSVFLMDWVTLPSSDHIVAKKTLLPTSPFKLKYAPQISADANIEKILQIFKSFALRVT